MPSCYIVAHEPDYLVGDLGIFPIIHFQRIMLGTDFMSDSVLGAEDRAVKQTQTKSLETPQRKEEKWEI